jgi:MFS family permease
LSDSEQGSGTKDGGMRNVYALGAVSFFTDVSTEMVISVLPSFLVEVLGASKAEIGLIEGIAEASSNIFRMVSGYISDWVGRRKLLVFIGYGLSALTKPLFALSSSWTDALLVRFTDRVGKAVRTAPRDSLLSASVPSEKLGRVFGLHRALDQSGAILGPLLATVLLPILSFKGLFYFSLVPALLALLILVFVVQEVAASRAGGTMFGNIREAANADFLKFLAVAALFSVGAYNYSFILLSAGAAGVEDQFIPLVYMLINLMHVVISIPAGTLSDKVGRERVLAGGYGLLAIASATLALPTGGVIKTLVAACAFGLYMGTVETIQRAIVPKYVAPKLRGIAYGLYYLTVGVFYLVANVAVGLLWDNVGAPAAFAYSLITSSLACLAMMLLITAKSGNS